MKSAPGTLFVVATPIGNLGDITLRALEVLASVDLVAAEDTRQTRKLFSRHGISTPMISYRRGKEAAAAEKILDTLSSGRDVALVSDAGTPGVSDPGLTLLAEAHRRKLRVVPVPGASALTALLSVSDLPGPFLFLGFLPARQGERKARLQELAAEPWNLMFFEAPHRLLATLEDCLATLGDRRTVFGRELTKVHEEVESTTLEVLLEMFKSRPAVKGECVFLVAGAPVKEPSEEEVLSLLKLWRRQGRPLSETVKEISRELGVSRTDLYRKALEVWKEE